MDTTHFDAIGLDDLEEALRAAAADFDGRIVFGEELQVLDVVDPT